jgi:hypothetical protein
MIIWKTYLQIIKFTSCYLDENIMMSVECREPNNISFSLPFLSAFLKTVSYNFNDIMLRITAVEEISKKIILCFCGFPAFSAFDDDNLYSLFEII